jgi:hypothetical protein
MATLSRLRNIITDPDDEIKVPNLRVDPRLVPTEELLQAFCDKLNQLERRKKALILRYQLRDKGPLDRSNDTVMFREQLARLEKEDGAVSPKAPAAPELVGSKTLLDALAVVKDLPIVATLDHAGQLKMLDRQLEAIELGVREQTEIRDALVAELSLEYSKNLAPAWNELHLQQYRAAQELSRVTAKVRKLRADVVLSGMKSCSWILATPNVRSPLILGDESQYDSEISGWRRILEGMGILR